MKRILALVPILMLGCSHKEMAAQTQPEMSQSESRGEKCPAVKADPMSQAAMAGRLDILTSSGLTQDQKVKFMDVMNQTHLKVTEIKKQEAELKAALFRSLSEGLYDKKLANSSKEKLTKLEHEKLSLMFSSLEKIRGILGQNVKINPEIFRGYHDNTLF